MRMVVPAPLVRASYKALIHSTPAYKHSLPLFARASSSTCSLNTIVLPVRFPVYSSMRKPGHAEVAAQDPIRVSQPTVKQEKVGIPEHWDGPNGKAFKNPWQSFRLASIGDMFGVCLSREN